MYTHFRMYTTCCEITVENDGRASIYDVPYRYITVSRKVVQRPSAWRVDIGDHRSAAAFSFYTYKKYGRPLLTSLQKSIFKALYL